MIYLIYLIKILNQVRKLFIHGIKKDTVSRMECDSFMTYEEFTEKVSSVILTENGNCPVTPVIQMLQGKWKLQIIYELCIKSPMRFRELKKMLKPITNAALTNALKELEKDELVQRIQYNEMPLRVEYSLTGKGQDLLPVFYAISKWGMKYIP